MPVQVRVWLWVSGPVIKARDNSNDRSLLLDHDKCIPLEAWSSSHRSCRHGQDRSCQRSGKGHGHAMPRVQLWRQPGLQIYEQVLRWPGSVRHLGLLWWVQPHWRGSAQCCGAAIADHPECHAGECHLLPCTFTCPGLIGAVGRQAQIAGIRTVLYSLFEREKKKSGVCFLWVAWVMSWWCRILSKLSQSCL